VLKRRGFYFRAKALRVPLPLALVLVASAIVFTLIGFVVLFLIGAVAAALIAIPILLSRGGGTYKRFEDDGSTVVLKPREYKVLEK
jgi:hypothetical protein